MIPSCRAKVVLLLALALTAFIVPRNRTAIMPSSQGLYTIPKVEIHPVRSKTNLILYTPRHGDQCWDSHLLCAPYPNLSLRLRSQFDLGQGFAVAK